jgi:hypothetical protein
VAMGEKLAAEVAAVPDTEAIDQAAAATDEAAVTDQTSPADQTASRFANADVTATRGLDPSAKMMFRKLGRKTIKR